MVLWILEVYKWIGVLTNINTLEEDFWTWLHTATDIIVCSHW